MANGTSGRPRTCECGGCAVCLKRERERERYAALSAEQRRAISERRDPAKVARSQAAYKRRRWPRRGYASSPGALNPSWKGDAASDSAKRRRARRLIPSLGACEDCGAPATERHHADGTPGNNDRGNLRLLCRRCHMAADQRLERNLAGGRRGRRA